MGQVLEPKLTISVSLLATLGSGTYGLLLQGEKWPEPFPAATGSPGVSDGSEDVCRLAMKTRSDRGQAPLSATSVGRPRAVALSPGKQAAQCPTCCAQHARREWREDCAGSGDSDEDEGAEALAGFFRLVVEMWGVFCGRTISREASGGPRTYIAGGFGSAAKLGAEGERSGDSGERAHSA